MQSVKKRFRPNRPASHPLIGRTTAFAARYDVSTQVLWLLLAARPPAIYGNATLAMLVSSTSMNAARATTTPISQGLNFGFQRSCAGGGDGGSGTSGVGALWIAIPGTLSDPLTCLDAGGDLCSARARGRFGPECVALLSHNSRLHFPAGAG